MKLTTLKKAWLLVLLILIADQILKIWIKTHLMLGEEIPIFGNWFILHFTENNGMAFGLEFGGPFGKMILSLFRIIAIAAIGFYLYYLGKHKAHKGYIYTMALIFAGAMGNLIDSAFYGVIFNDSYRQVATLFPAEGGYAGLLHGRVVDMFYAPIIRTTLPNWVPIWGGEFFEFFRPVFNLADSSISIGVILIFLFQNKFFKK